MTEKSFLSKLQVKLYCVYFLNVLDWIFTLMLLKTGLFYEANPIARTFIESFTLSFTIKCIIPLALIILVCKCLHLLDFSQMKTADMVICFGLTVYLAVIVDHIINFIILINTNI